MNLTPLDYFLWGIFPYITLAIVIGGTIWRYKTDQFGWTTRSSQMYESKLLRIASPMFHYGILVVLVGHIVGLVIPKSWTDAVGISEYFYHLNALWLGSVAAVATLVGLFAMIYRRRTSATVFRATTWNDKLMYVALASAIVLGSTLWRSRVSITTVRPCRSGSVPSSTSTPMLRRWLTRPPPSTFT